MTRLSIALMVAMLLVIWLVQPTKQLAEVDCNFSDDPIACILRQHGH